MFDCMMGLLSVRLNGDLRYKTNGFLRFGGVDTTTGARAFRDRGRSTVGLRPRGGLLGMPSFIARSLTGRSLGRRPTTVLGRVGRACRRRGFGSLTDSRCGSRAHVRLAGTANVPAEARPRGIALAW
jgi:hypothetical protein